MDVKQFMIGVLISTIVFVVFGIAISGITLTYNTADTHINDSYNPIQNQSVSMQNELNKTAASMNSAFTEEEPSTLGTLNDLYTAAGATAKLVIKSIGMPFAMISTIASQYSWAKMYISIAFTALVLVVVLSVAYLVFFRIPK